MEYHLHPHRLLHTTTTTQAQGPAATWASNRFRPLITKRLPRSIDARLGLKGRGREGKVSERRSRFMWPGCDA